ncbi:hypothetical protein LDENG_00192610 [Lucifuga dentata]|nr:hypothetical protein LDENG_00192610 [Lucifuga dentata]
MHVHSGPATVGLSSMLSAADEFLRLLAEFPALTQPIFLSSTARHGVEHHISTTGPPVHAQARRLHPAKLTIAKGEFENMERLGIIRRSDSPWASSLHIVLKPGGGWRPCGYYCRLNDVMTPDRYLVLHIQAGCIIFSKMDLIHGCYQIPVHLRDIPNTAVITPFGLFKFLRMPFGLKNVAQTFQVPHGHCAQEPAFPIHLSERHTRCQLLQGGASVTPPDSLQVAQPACLILNPAKCQFRLTTIDFLGHHVTKDGAVPLPSKVDTVTNFPLPLTVRALQEFLGMVYFYHCFIPQAAQLTRPLYEALKGKATRHVVDWTAEREKAFVDTQAALANEIMLAHPSPKAPIAITMDVSDYAVGTVHEQWVNGAWQPLTFFSRQLKKAITGAVCLGLDYTCMAADQVSDPDIQALRMVVTGLRLEDVAFDNVGTTLLCNISTGQPRPSFPLGGDGRFLMLSTVCLTQGKAISEVGGSQVPLAQA